MFMSFMWIVKNITIKRNEKNCLLYLNNGFTRTVFNYLTSKQRVCFDHNIFKLLILIRYEQQEIALNCGTMLRECGRYEALAKIMLHSEDFFNFFRYVEVSTFDIASDAFSTFKVSFI